MRAALYKPALIYKPHRLCIQRGLATYQNYHRLGHKAWSALSNQTRHPYTSLRDHSRKPKMALIPSTTPLVWIDCEMTGLDPSKDSILSICCILTTYDLKPLPASAHDMLLSYNAVIRTPKNVLDSMSQWCIDTHGRTGLTEACQSPEAITAEQAARELRAFIDTHIPPGSTSEKPLLAGNSVHADKLFLRKCPWDVVLQPLHYRLFDVSAIKEAARRWCTSEILDKAPRKKLIHNAEEDIRESIQEARYYMNLFQNL